MPVQNLGAARKDQIDSRTYSIDWTAWLAGLAGADTIATSTWVVPSPLTLVNQSNTTTKVNVRISGGTTTVVAYTIYNTVTTTAGEIKRVSFILTV